MRCDNLSDRLLILFVTLKTIGTRRLSIETADVMMKQTIVKKIQFPIFLNLQIKTACFYYYLCLHFF